MKEADKIPKKYIGTDIGDINREIKTLTNRLMNGEPVLEQLLQSAKKREELLLNRSRK